MTAEGLADLATPAAEAPGGAAEVLEEKEPPPELPRIKQLRVCLLGGDAFVPGVGKADVAAALLRGLTADRPGIADPLLDFSFDYGVFERAWRTLLDPGGEAEPQTAEAAEAEEAGEESQATRVARADKWGIGFLDAWDGEGRVRFDRRSAGESTPPFDPDPTEDCAALCAGSAGKLTLGHKRSVGNMRAFREALQTAGQDLGIFDGLHKEMQEAAEASPRELVRKDRPRPGLLAAFARHSPEVGELVGCGTVALSVFEPDSRPLGNPHNVAMLYATAPNGRRHRGLSPASFLCALRCLGSNMARTVREYNRFARAQSAPESWERTMWWEVDLRAQVEYYLSDRHLLSDAFFRSKIQSDEGGWLDMELLKGCQGATLQAELLGALSSSKTVETKVAEDGRVFVRRTGGRPLPVTENLRTLRMKRKFAEWRRKSEDPNCWDFQTRGVCPRGESCRYIHSGPGANGGAPPAGRPPPPPPGGLRVPVPDGASLTAEAAAAAAAVGLGEVSLTAEAAAAAAAVGLRSTPLTAEAAAAAAAVGLGDPQLEPTAAEELASAGAALGIDLSGLDHLVADEAMGDLYAQVEAGGMEAALEEVAKEEAAMAAAAAAAAAEDPAAAAEVMQAEQPAEAAPEDLPVPDEEVDWEAVAAPVPAGMEVELESSHEESDPGDAEIK